MAFKKSSIAEQDRPRKIGRPKSGFDLSGNTKIMDALKALLEEKGFQEITWGEIARTAGVSDALIYRYFKTKQGLLYAVLAEYFKKYRSILWEKLDQTEGALNKIRALIYGVLSLHNENRVFARIVILEVRNYQDYFESEAYALLREFLDKYLEILEEGIKLGEIRDDIPPKKMRQIHLGGIEHAILPYIIFKREVDIDKLSEQVSTLLIDAIRSRN